MDVLFLVEGPAPLFRDCRDIFLPVFCFEGSAPAALVFASSFSIKLTTFDKFSLTNSYSFLTRSTSSLRLSTRRIRMSVSVSPS